MTAPETTSIRMSYTDHLAKASVYAAFCSIALMFVLAITLLPFLGRPIRDFRDLVDPVFTAVVFVVPMSSFLVFYAVVAVLTSAVVIGVPLARLMKRGINRGFFLNLMLGTAMALTPLSFCRLYNEWWVQKNLYVIYFPDRKFGRKFEEALWPGGDASLAIAIIYGLLFGFFFWRSVRSAERAIATST